MDSANGVQTNRTATPDHLADIFFWIGMTMAVTFCVAIVAKALIRDFMLMPKYLGVAFDVKCGCLVEHFGAEDPSLGAFNYVIYPAGVISVVAFILMLIIVTRRPASVEVAD